MTKTITLNVIISDKGVFARVRLSVCLLARLLRLLHHLICILLYYCFAMIELIKMDDWANKDVCMDLDEMLHVDKCLDMDELVNFWVRSGL